MKVTLHIGRPKTASSTIQRWLFLASQDLESKDIYVPSLLGRENHRLFYTLIKARFKKEDIGFLRRGIKDVADREAFAGRIDRNFVRWIKSLPRDAHVVMSCEQLSSLEKEEIIWVKEYLGKVFADIEVVVYIRRQDLSYVSLYNTKILSGSGGLYSGKFGFPQKIPKNYFYDRFLNRWAEVYGKTKISVRCLDQKYLRGGSVVEDFMQCLGLKEANKLKDSLVSNNQSVSASMLEFVRRLNDVLKKGYDLDEYEAAKLGSIIQKTAKIGADGGKIFKPDRESAEKFYRQFASSNYRVANEFFGRNKLFSEDFSMYPECEITNEEEEVTEAALRFCSALLLMNHK